MQPGFRRPFWPLVIFFFKATRHFSEIRTASNPKRWFYKKPVLKELNMIAYPIRVEYSETITTLLPFSFLNVCHIGIACTAT